ncbi:homing endonuclease associated repeat-containing protein [Halomicrococcus sp. SG-WS-1]|uniref:homing endonuclease associated repeat-containing protein n=1 Tax=Halomicrococcus sp. SG-WS-1 TaxID=3439057 RepID=UPI003F794624
MLAEPERVAAELETTPTQREMREHDDYAPKTHANHFGSWNAAIRAVGLEPNQAGH